MANDLVAPEPVVSEAEREAQTRLAAVPAENPSAKNVFCADTGGPDSTAPNAGDVALGPTFGKPPKPQPPGFPLEDNGKSSGGKR